MQMDPEMKDINRQIKHADEHSFYVASMDVYHPQYRQQKAHLAILQARIEHATAAYYKKKATDEATHASQDDFRERRKQFDERARAYRSQQKQTLAAAKAAAEEEAEYVFVQEPDVEEDWVVV